MTTKTNMVTKGIEKLCPTPKFDLHICAAMCPEGARLLKIRYMMSTYKTCALNTTTTTDTSQQQHYIFLTSPNLHMRTTRYGALLFPQMMVRDQN